MVDEKPFRIALMVVFAVTVVVAGYHRWQAARSGERISRRDEGLVFAVVLRMFGLCTWGALLVYIIDSQRMRWASVPLPDAVRWLGVVVVLLALAGLYWTLTNLGKNLTDTVVTRSNATLVTSGPYRWIRHPFYVTTGLMLGGATLLAANWFIAATGALCLLLLAIRSKTEEQMLLARFGEPYRRYRAVTGAFFPRWRA